MSNQKRVVLAVWIAGLLASLFASGILATIGSVVVGFLVIAHLIECVVFRKELADAPGSMGEHLFQTFLFGVVHMQEVRASAGGGPEGDA